MTKPKILITRKIHSQVVDFLNEYCEVEMWSEEQTVMPRETLLKKVTDIEGLYCFISDTIDAELLDAAPQLKVVSNMAVGYNNIDVKACQARHITVTNTPGVLTDTTADLTFALLMATSRRLLEASDYLRKGKWQSWYPTQLTGQDISGATLGIFGMGRIGEALAKRANGFDMKILYHNRHRNEQAEKTLGAMYVSKEELLQEADFVCLLMPYSEETRNFIAKEELQLMKPSAILINTARGGIVNEEDLYDALIQKQIWAAGLDVFEKEPVRLNHPLLRLPNVVTLPHIGSASIATRLNMAKLAAENLVDAVTGKTPKHVVRP